jgi:hypothetical protein
MAAFFSSAVRAAAVSPETEGPQELGKGAGTGAVGNSEG